MGVQSGGPATGHRTRRSGLLPGIVGLLVVVATAWLVAWHAGAPVADARGHWLGAGPPVGAYPWSAEPDPDAQDPWGFFKRQCTSYAAWYLNSHGVPFAARTRGPTGVGAFRDAGGWDLGAALAGFPVSDVPAVGSIAQWHIGEVSPPSPGPRGTDDRYPPYRDDPDLTAGSHGHVAVVMTVLPDGSVLLAGYDGGDRQLELVHTRAPRYLYIGVPGPASPAVAVPPGVALAAAGRLCS